MYFSISEKKWLVPFSLKVQSSCLESFLWANSQRLYTQLIGTSSKNESGRKKERKEEREINSKKRTCKQDDLTESKNLHKVKHDFLQDYNIFAPLPFGT